ncbi:MAG: hypothetical protein NBV65_05030 [Burkholderiaceae bacterium]|nr:hypothetical protein [Burkholderiaceae bacterium]
MTRLQILTVVLVAGYFVVVLISLVRRRRVLSGRWLFLLRSFFPNWRFYHGFGHQPRLFVRSATADGRWGPWQMFMPRARWSAAELFHNPGNNLLLAQQNLVDHLSFDVQTLPDGQDVRELVTYRMVSELARTLVDAQPMQATHWQFEMRLVPPLEDADESMAVLTSPVLAAA